MPSVETNIPQTEQSQSVNGKYTVELYILIFNVYNILIFNVDNHRVGRLYS